MKYIITTIITSVFLFANVSYAGTPASKENATNGWGNEEVVTNSNAGEEVNGSLTHYYLTEEIQIRQNNRVCNEVDVPIYSTKDKTGNIIIGSILGGVIGKKIDNGGDGGAVLGAILGGAIANEDAESKKTIVGYKRTTICEDSPTYVTQIRKVYDYSTIKFTDRNGKSYTIRFIAENK